MTACLAVRGRARSCLLLLPVSALASIVEVAKQGVDVEAFHWSAMNFNRHWR
eukprot:COSAG01_NODE_1405_length_10451_cov_8.718998_6_plen_52_part_00